MKIIFYSYSGVHSAVLTGAAFLGGLSPQKAASLDFKQVPFFCCKENKYQLRYLRADNKGNQVYTLGMQNETELIPRAIREFLKMANISPDNLIMFNTYAYLSRLSRWGEMLARKGLVGIGNYLAYKGLKKDFPILIQEANLKLKESQS